MFLCTPPIINNCEFLFTSLADTSLCTTNVIWKKKQLFIIGKGPLLQLYEHTVDGKARKTRKNQTKWRSKQNDLWKIVEVIWLKIANSSKFGTNRQTKYNVCRGEEQLTSLNFHLYFLNTAINKLKLQVWVETLYQRRICTSWLN